MRHLQRAEFELPVRKPKSPSYWIGSSMEACSSKSERNIWTSLTKNIKKQTNILLDNFCPLTAALLPKAGQRKKKVWSLPLPSVCLFQFWWGISKASSAKPKWGKFLTPCQTNWQLFTISGNHLIIVPTCCSMLFLKLCPTAGLCSNKAKLPGDAIPSSHTSGASRGAQTLLWE